MVIDKTTGRGCAWSIASKTITKKLIAEGIVDKTIFIKAWKNGYDLLRVTDCGVTKDKGVNRATIMGPFFYCSRNMGKSCKQISKLWKIGQKCGDVSAPGNE